MPWGHSACRPRPPRPPLPLLNAHPSRAAAPPQAEALELEPEQAAVVRAEALAARRDAAEESEEEEYWEGDEEEAYGDDEEAAYDQVGGPGRQGLRCRLPGACGAQRRQCRGSWEARGMLLLPGA
jgi:hypothetical protein